MKVTIKYMLYFGMVFIHSCVDPISFETDSAESQLVFYGNFSQLNEKHIFNISQTSVFGKLATPVSGAIIVIIDDQGNCADYQETDLGKYELDTGKIPGIPGRAYHIEITLANGKTYASVPQIMPEPVEIEDVYFEIESRQILSSSDVLVDKTFIDVYIDTPLPNIADRSTHLRWSVEEVYSFVDRSCGPLDGSEQCYFIDPVDESELILFENESGAQKFIRGLNVRSRLLVPYDEFTARHYFIVRQYAISEQELEYWQRIDAVANQSGSLFDVPPAKVIGNIIEKGNEQAGTLGYFGVNGQSVLRTFSTPTDIKPNPVFTCMDDSFFREHLPECCFCWQKEGIQIERPAYWDED